MSIIFPLNLPKTVNKKFLCNVILAVRIFKCKIKLVVRIEHFETPEIIVLSPVGKIKFVLKTKREGRRKNLEERIIK